MSDQDAAAEPAAEPQPCPPCRGTGKVISNLGGSPSTIDCPWCEGSGVLTLEHDAQAHWREDAAAQQDEAQPQGAPDRA